MPKPWFGLASAGVATLELVSVSSSSLNIESAAMAVVPLPPTPPPTSQQSGQSNSIPFDAPTPCPTGPTQSSVQHSLNESNGVRAGEKGDSQHPAPVPNSTPASHSSHSPSAASISSHPTNPDDGHAAPP